MRAPRWAFALTALGTAGATALVVGLPGSALADSNAPAAAGDRYELKAFGDAFYFQVDGDEIPASPKNEAGSLTAVAVTNNAGGSNGFAGAPYYGNTVQTLPGTINGVPNQFGAGQLQLPFAVLPGYVQTRSSGTQKDADEGGYYRVASESQELAATSSGKYGAPGAIPAPNQQQTADAKTDATGKTAIASASGSSSGIVSGPLEIANSTAVATITAPVGKTPTIVSKAFGQFSVSGQAFGFDQNGFRYLGQEMESETAVKMANDTLKAANIQLDVAPVETGKADSGAVEYTIGGLKITTTQASPTGAGDFTFSYIIGRAKVSAVNESLAFAGGNSSSDSTTPAVDKDTSAGTDSSVTDVAPVSGLDTVVPSTLPGGTEVPSTVSTVTESGEVAAAPGAVAPAAGAEQQKTLGFVPASQTRGDNSELLYAMLVLAGVGVLGGHFLFTRFAVAARGA